MIKSLSNIKIKSLIYSLGSLTLIELILCGSGQILKLGPLTLRMVLFCLCIGLSFLICLKHRPLFSVNDVRIYSLFLMIFLFSIGLGLVNQAEFKFLVEDIKPLSYFLIFPFLLLLIRSHKSILLLNKLLLYIPLIMAVTYLMYLIVIKLLGIVTFMDVYDSASSQSDFMFRGTHGELFYKGFIYLPIGLIFWVNKKKKIPSLLILLAIFFTLTRGFYIIVFIGCLIYYYLSAKKATKKLAIIILSVFSLIIGSIAITFLTPSDRQEGDEVRIKTFNQVVEDSNLLSILVGHGYGIGVPIRRTHMENSFLEIFQKSGLFALCFWFYFLLCIYRYYRNSKNKPRVKLYFIGSVMIYIQSLFNPFITNPIGMGFVMISYCVAKYYSNEPNSRMLCSIQSKSIEYKNI